MTVAHGSGRATSWTRRATFPSSLGRLPGSMRGRRSSTGRWWRSTPRGARASACCRTGRAFAPAACRGRRHPASRRRSSTRPSTCSISTVARCCSCRSRSASGCCARACARIRASDTPATSSATAWRSPRPRAPRSWRASWPSCAARHTSQAAARAAGSSSSCAASRRWPWSGGSRGRGRIATSARSSSRCGRAIGGSTPGRWAAGSTRGPVASCASRSTSLPVTHRSLTRRRG